MSKGGSTKSTETIHKLARSREFRDDVRAIRVKVGMPSGGYRDEKHEDDYTKARRVPTITMLEAVELLNKYHLPTTYLWPMQQYIRFERTEVAGDTELETLGLEYPDNPKLTTASEQSLKKLKQPYVGLFVLDGSSKDKVLALIRRHWKEIQQSLKAQGSDISRVRVSQNKKRNLLISMLYEKTKSELCDEAGIEQSARRGIYKELVISRLLEEKYGYPGVSFETVKKYVLSPKRALPTDKSRDKRSIKGSRK